jgi:hypothetical protein
MPVRQLQGAIEGTSQCEVVRCEASLLGHMVAVKPKLFAVMKGEREINRLCSMRPSRFRGTFIGCPTSSVAQANLTIKINFNILRSFSSSDMLTIYLHKVLNHSMHLFEKNCVQGLPRDFRQNNSNMNKKFRWSFSAISHQLSFDVAKKEKRKKSDGAKYGE